MIQQVAISQIRGNITNKQEKDRIIDVTTPKKAILPPFIGLPVHSLSRITPKYG